MQGSLNWGPAPNLNGILKSSSWWTDKRKSFGADFHTYALEWTPEFLYVLASALPSLYFRAISRASRVGLNTLIR